MENRESRTVSRIVYFRRGEGKKGKRVGELYIHISISRPFLFLKSVFIPLPISFYFHSQDGGREKG